MAQVPQDAGGRTPDAVIAVLQLVERQIEATARQGFALATINLDHLVKLRHSAPFRAAYAAQDLVVADGNPIVGATASSLLLTDAQVGKDAKITTTGLFKVDATATNTATASATAATRLKRGWCAK